MVVSRRTSSWRSFRNAARKSLSEVVSVKGLTGSHVVLLTVLECICQCPVMLTWVVCFTTSPNIEKSLTRLRCMVVSRRILPWRSWTDKGKSLINAGNFLEKRLTGAEWRNAVHNFLDDIENKQKFLKHCLFWWMLFEWGCWLKVISVPSNTDKFSYV